MGFAGRMILYSREMFPLQARLPLAAFTYLGIASFTRGVHGLPRRPISLDALAGTGFVFLTLLLLRLMDELKDEEIDRELFPDRPLPSGRVRKRDIQISLAATVLALLGLVATTGWAAVPGLLVVAYAFLMFVRFFAPGPHRRSLLLTLATHTEIVPLMMLQCALIAASMNGLEPRRLRWDALLPYTGLLWSAGLSWELARKIRSKEEETAYVTYSRIFGRIGAVFVTGGVQTAGLAIGLWLGFRLGLSWAWPALIAAGWAVSAAGLARFLARPNPGTSKLGPFAQVYAAGVIAASLAAFAGAPEGGP